MSETGEKTRRFGWAGALLVVMVPGAVTVAGCAAGPPPAPAHAPGHVRNMATGNPMDGGTVSDATIVAVLVEELGAQPSLVNQVVGVRSTRGLVELQGHVDNLLARDRALEIAHVVRGVRAVVDRIEVVSRARPDRVIDLDVMDALARDPVTAGAGITAEAHDAVVYLAGHVSSEGTRRVAATDVLGIPGVQNLVNGIVVRPGALDDARVAATAARLLADDVWLDGPLIRVGTRNGMVVLTGTVGSAAGRARARTDAALASPRGAVDTSELGIDEWLDEWTLRDAPRVRSDGDLGQALLDAYVRDPRVHPFVPTVDVRDGAVILTGVAPNARAATAAADDARNLPGATSVHDFMKTRPAWRPETDASIGEQVASAFVAEQRPGLGDVGITVAAGRVYLRGRVRDQAARIAAIGLAAGVPGTRDVQDGLVVAREAPP